MPWADQQCFRLQTGKTYTMTTHKIRVRNDMRSNRFALSLKAIEKGPV